MPSFNQPKIEHINMKNFKKIDINKTTVDMVHETTDYDGLIEHRFTSNRMVSKTHITKTALSILESNQIAPVILGADGAIIDGQHRVAACEHLGIPVKFLIMSSIIDSEKAQAIVNTGQKNWTELDFLHSGIEQDIENYCLVKKLTDTYNCNIGTLSSTRVIPSLQHTIKRLDPIQLNAPVEDLLNTLDEYQLITTAYKKLFVCKKTVNFDRAFGYVNKILRPKIPNFSWEYVAKNLEHTKTDPNYATNIPRVCYAERDFIHYFGSAFNYKKTAGKQNHLFFQGKLTK